MQRNTVPGAAPMNDLLAQAPHGAAPQQNLLADLRGLHEPDPVSAWPPAPGWWIVALLVLFALVYFYIKAVRYNRKRAYRRDAIHELMLAREDYRSTGDGHAYAQQILELLKRTALTAYPNDSQRIAGLHGTAWLKFLDSTCASCNFNSAEGRGLLSTAYGQATDEFALQQSYIQARMWIAAHRGFGGLLSA